MSVLLLALVPPVTVLVLQWGLPALLKRCGVGTVTLRVPNAPRSDRLAEVVLDMRRMGSPGLRAHQVPGGWHAVEGSHRVAAAMHLGIPIHILPVSGGDRLVDSGWVDADTQVPVSAGWNVVRFLRCNRAVFTYEMPARLVVVVR